MAHKGPSYGLSAELKLKQEAKYDPEEAKKCLGWIKQVTAAGLDVNSCKTDEQFAEQLKSGQALCKLINAIAPWLGAKDQHHERHLQAEGEHRDVPGGLLQVRPQPG